MAEKRVTAGVRSVIVALCLLCGSCSELVIDENSGVDLETGDAGADDGGSRPGIRFLQDGVVAAEEESPTGTDSAARTEPTTTPSAPTGDEATTGETPPTETPRRGPATDAEIEAEVTEAFEAFQDALLDYDGQAALAYLTTTTIAWFDEIVEQAAIADEQALLEELPIGTFVWVVDLRAALAVEVVAIDDGTDLVMLSIESGVLAPDLMYGTLDSLDVLSSSDVLGTVTGPQVLIPGPYRFTFEDGWRIHVGHVGPGVTGVDESYLRAFSDGAVSTRREFIELTAEIYGTTWDELRQPPGLA